MFSTAGGPTLEPSTLFCARTTWWQKPAPTSCTRGGGTLVRKFPDENVCNRWSGIYWLELYSPCARTWQEPCDRQLRQTHLCRQSCKPRGHRAPPRLLLYKGGYLRRC